MSYSDYSIYRDSAIRSSPHFGSSPILDQVSVTDIGPPPGSTLESPDSPETNSNQTQQQSKTFSSLIQQSKSQIQQQQAQQNFNKIQQCQSPGFEYEGYSITSPQMFTQDYYQKYWPKGSQGEWNRTMTLGSSQYQSEQLSQTTTVPGNENDQFNGESNSKLNSKSQQSQTQSQTSKISQNSSQNTDSQTQFGQQQHGHQYNNLDNTTIPMGIQSQTQQQSQTNLNWYNSDYQQYSQYGPNPNPPQYLNLNPSKGLHNSFGPYQQQQQLNHGIGFGPYGPGPHSYGPWAQYQKGGPGGLIWQVDPSQYWQYPHLHGPGPQAMNPEESSKLNTNDDHMIYQSFYDPATDVTTTAGSGVTAMQPESASDNSVGSVTSSNQNANNSGSLSQSVDVHTGIINDSNKTSESNQNLQDKVPQQQGRLSPQLITKLRNKLDSVGKFGRYLRYIRFLLKAPATSSLPATLAISLLGLMIGFFTTIIIGSVINIMTDGKYIMHPYREQKYGVYGKQWKYSESKESLRTGDVQKITVFDTAQTTLGDSDHQHSFKQLVAEQQPFDDPNSPQYHKWMDSQQKQKLIPLSIQYDPNSLSYLFYDFIHNQLPFNIYSPYSIACYIRETLCEWFLPYRVFWISPDAILLDLAEEIGELFLGETMRDGGRGYYGLAIQQQNHQIPAKQTNLKKSVIADREGQKTDLVSPEYPEYATSSSLLEEDSFTRQEVNSQQYQFSDSGDHKTKHNGIHRQNSNSESDQTFSEDQEPSSFIQKVHQQKIGKFGLEEYQKWAERQGKESESQSLEQQVDESQYETEMDHDGEKDEKEKKETEEKSKSKESDEKKDSEKESDKKESEEKDKKESEESEKKESDESESKESDSKSKDSKDKDKAQDLLISQHLDAPKNPGTIDTVAEEKQRQYQTDTWDGIYDENGQLIGTAKVNWDFMKVWLKAVENEDAANFFVQKDSVRRWSDEIMYRLAKYDVYQGSNAPDPEITGSAALQLTEASVTTWTEVINYSWKLNQITKSMGKTSSSNSNTKPFPIKEGIVTLSPPGTQSQQILSIHLYPGEKLFVNPQCDYAFAGSMATHESMNKYWIWTTAFPQAGMNGYSSKDQKSIDTLTARNRLNKSSRSGKLLMDSQGSWAIYSGPGTVYIRGFGSIEETDVINTRFRVNGRYVMAYRAREIFKEPQINEEIVKEKMGEEKKSKEAKGGKVSSTSDKQTDTESDSNKELVRNDKLKLQQEYLTPLSSSSLMSFPTSANPPQQLDPDDVSAPPGAGTDASEWFHPKIEIIEVDINYKDKMEKEMAPAGSGSKGDSPIARANRSSDSTTTHNNVENSENLMTMNGESKIKNKNDLKKLKNLRKNMYSVKKLGGRELNRAQWWQTVFTAPPGVVGTVWYQTKRSWGMGGD